MIVKRHFYLPSNDNACIYKETSMSCGMEHIPFLKVLAQCEIKTDSGCSVDSKELSYTHDFPPSDLCLI